MKRFITLLACLIFTLTLFAQENNSRLNVRKLELVPRDTEGSVARKVDGNDKPCALIKIQTPNMNEAERNKLEFYADRGTFVYPHKAVGEVKLYLTNGCKTLIIMHPDYGKLIYDMPISVEGYKTYEMVLDANKDYAPTTLAVNKNWVVINVTPPEAVVTVDGKLCNGQIMLTVNEPHELEVKHELYHDYTKTIYASDKEKMKYEVVMDPAFGWLNIQSQPENGAVVMINGKRMGVTPYQSDKMTSGEYEVSLLMDMYEKNTKTVRVRDNNTSDVSIPLKPLFANINIATDSESEIYIDNVLQGKGQWTGRLAEGEYVVVAKKASHRDSGKTIEVTAGKDQTVSLPAPTPVYGQLNITTEPSDVIIYLDGVKIGESPMLQNNVLIGQHSLTFEKEGYLTREKNVEVIERQMVTVSETLEEGKHITIIADDESIWVNGKFCGYFPLNDSLSDALNFPKNYEDAFRLYKQNADKGDADAQNNLGVCYFLGKGVKQNYKQAVKWFEAAYNNGNVSAQCNLADCYYVGDGVAQDKEQAKKLFNGVANGFAYAQLSLGTIYMSDENYEEALKWNRMAAEQGYPGGQRAIGSSYYSGNGVKQDFNEAVKWFELASNNGSLWAHVELGNCYYNGYGVKQDYAEAVKWFRKSADQGLAYAQLYLGICYENGYGVDKDYKQAITWYRKAADQDLASAQNRLGLLYSDGKGTRQDSKEAVKWFRKAAEHGYAIGQSNLAYCYYYAEGVNQDYKEAVKWFQKSAEQGCISGQFFLGQCYETGHGVTKDLNEARKWYQKAADQGDEDAKKKLKELQ